MFWRILKKDLKRKKTMNIILLLFVVLSALFAAAAVNNIIAVTGGLDYYFEKAGMADYFVISRDSDGKSEVGDLLAKSRYVKKCRAEKTVFAAVECYKTDKGKLMDFSNVSLICDIADTKLNFFDEDDSVITGIEKGTVRFTGGIPRREGVTAGEAFTFRLGDTKLKLEVAGLAKDAFLGSDMMGNPRMLMNSEDFKALCEDETISRYSMGHIFYIDTDSVSNLESELSDLNGIMFSGDAAMIKMTYMMNMLIAVIILVISIGLLVVSFVVLRFTIRFTISEEFREIGVMKAIGIGNSQVRVLYLVKYLGIAVTGSVIGYFGSIPFGNMLLKSVSENMVLGNDESILTGILCCVAVVLIILLFSWGSTRGVSRLSPIDAVRNGQSGERFGKRNLLSLGKSRLGSTGFLALNDVLSERRQYGILTVIFAICTSLVMILAVTANTLDSDSLLYLFSVTESDVYISDSTRAMDVMAGVKSIRETENEIEKILSENDMSGTIHMEGWYKLPVTAKDKHFNVTFLKCSDTKTTDYEYTKGTAPVNADEIAITQQIADKLNVGIGNHISVNIGGEEKEFLITAYFQCFNQLGECARFHEAVSIPDTLMTSAFAYQVDFDDHPDSTVISERIEKLKELMDNENIFDTRGFVRDSMGVGDTVAAVKNLVLILSLIIIILLAVLMERSFISKEKSETALLKAVGFDSGSVILYHTLRFGITVLIGIVISAVFFLPLTRLIMNPVFGMMGAIGAIDYQINAWEIFGIYPVIIFVVTIVSAALTALYTRTIKASDTASIE